MLGRDGMEGVVVIGAGIGRPANPDVAGGGGNQGDPGLTATPERCRLPALQRR